MAPRWVKKRDGRIEPFDEARIARAVIRAGRNAGRAEEVELLAREIARSVSLFLSRHDGRTPETARIAEAMEEALRETGHASLARAASDYRAWRLKRRAEVRVREIESPGPVPRSDASVEVLSHGAARPWTKQRIVQALAQQASLELEAAEDVARAVEERVFAAGLNQISTNLLRELIDAELFERGFSAQLGRLEVVGVPKEDMERLAFVGQGRVPIALEDAVARTSLERYALDELVAGPGATAHRRGDVHLVGLGRPFRLAAGAVDMSRLLSSWPDSRPLELTRRLIGFARAASTSYELSFGLVGFAQALSPQLGQGQEQRDALELLLEALVAPRPDELPPSPELALVVEAVGEGDEAKDQQRRALVSVLLELLAERGEEAAGVRLLLRVRQADARAAALIGKVVHAAQRGAGCDLVLGEGAGLSSRGMQPFVAAVQVGVINLAGLALAAGRGERQRLSRGLDDAVQSLLDAFHKRHRRVFASLVRPASPLFGNTTTQVAAPGPMVPEALADVLGVVGLEAALRYLTGEGPAENPRVAELGQELLRELGARVETTAARLGLGSILMEEVPDGDAAIRLAALDLDRFADARELLGDAPGWDSGVTLHSDDSGAVRFDELEVRLKLARHLGNPLFLARPALARVRDSQALAAGVLGVLDRHETGRLARGQGDSGIFRRYRPG